MREYLSHAEGNEVNQTVKSSRTTKLAPISLAVLMGLSLSACSVLEEDKIDYKSVGKGASLEVPPDLVQLSRDNRYLIPGNTTASSFDAAASVKPAGVPTAEKAIGDVQIERAGTQRWLVVGRAPEKVFPLLRDFWSESGFVLTTDDQNLGIMETDWAENRAKLPQDFIRNTLGKLIDSVYSTGERDKFRTRIERNGQGGTEIYVSHRGMVETYASAQKDTTVWQPRPADTELEAEFLRRIMVKLGATQAQSKQLLAVAPAKLTSKIVTQAGQPMVQIDEGFDRAWRRVGLTLDRTGFTVEDRDRTQGVYFVRYVAPVMDKKEPGFFAKMFSAEPTIPLLKYRITVKANGADMTMVSVLNAAGAPAVVTDAQNIVKVLADDLK